MHRPERPTAVALGLALLAAACGGGTPGTPIPGSGSVPGASARVSGEPSGGLLAPTLAPPDASGPGGGDEPVAFTRGKATLTLRGGATEDLELPVVAPLDSVFDPVEGTTVVWRQGDSGWYLTLSGYYREGKQPTNDPGPYLEIRAADDRHAQDLGGLCTVTVDAVSGAGFSGSAACTGLQWLDADEEPTGAPFDASVTFRAAP